MKRSPHPAAVLRAWLPPLVYSVCFLVLDYHSGGPAVYAENILDQFLAIPAGSITLLILPLASFVYIIWTDRQFGPETEFNFTVQTWILADIVPWAIAMILCIVDRPLTAYTLIAGVAWATLLLLRNISVRARNMGTRLTSTQEYIAVLFCLSGCSALIYQIVWQRVLFASFGMDSESVTIIVSVFMAGLGAGALFGSWLVRYENILLRLFLAAEIGIGVFGFFSIQVNQFLLQHTSFNSRAGLALMSYLLFAVPTLLMGTTLPLLVGHLDASYKNVGRSTGLLYAANTLGSALAALMTVSVIFVLTGQQGATTTAAFFNFSTAILLFLSMTRLEHPIVVATTPMYRGNKHTGIIITNVLSAAIGFVALSGELLFYRLLGFTAGGLPQVFGWLLAAYLCGIAAGSYRIKQLSELSNRETGLTAHVYAAGVIILLTPALLGFLSAIAGRPFALMAGLILCGLFGFLTGGVLPGLCNKAANSSGPGANRTAALVYASNIMGSALGPLVTGYFLLEYLPAARVSIVLALSLLIIGFCLHAEKRSISTATLAVFSLMCAGPAISAHYLSRLQHETLSPHMFRYIVENRVSIITVTPDPSGDIVYGGGVYDGRINIDPLNDSNGIVRAYYTACLHPDPRRLLEIGLSSGSWAKVMLSNNKVGEMTSIEINHGYGKLVSAYAPVREILDDPRFRLVYDDGRRWLQRHPAEKFDLIVMNTTFHWRANTSNLLSREYFRLVKNHLKPDGVFYFNSTGSIEAGYTAASVFKHILEYRNFYAASDTSFDMPAAQRRNNLLQYRNDSGKPYFLQSKRRERLMDSLAALLQTDISDELRNAAGFRVITDDNMLVEYKLGIFH